MRKSYPWLMLVAGVLVGLVVSGRLILFAQDRAGGGRSNPARPLDENATGGSTRLAESPEADDHSKDRAAPGGSTYGPTVQDLLVRPYRFPFSSPTSLSQVCTHLRRTLGIVVVLDRAALARQEVQPEATVQLELDGVRLKTGLKLLLDQVDLTYHVVTEDNLLVITDQEGSEDPLDRVGSELRALHRDLHDVQDAIDDLTDLLVGEQGEGPRVRKPTIIEELPEIESPKVEDPRGNPSTSPRKPNATQRPRPRPCRLLRACR